MRQNKRLRQLMLITGLAVSIGYVGVSYSEDSKESTVNQDQADGRVGEVKGTVKEVTGKILNDKGMEVEGNVQKNLGKAQAGYGDLKQEIKEEIKK